MPPPGGGPGGNVPNYNPLPPQGAPINYSHYDPNAPPAYNPAQPPAYNPGQPPAFDQNAQ
tara:strand:- start:274 stop:453 length:180 start_codon:yes stop_codon:yes gene_type:complete